MAYGTGTWVSVVVGTMCLRPDPSGLTAQRPSDAGKRSHGPVGDSGRGSGVGVGIGVGVKLWLSAVMVYIAFKVESQRGGVGGIACVREGEDSAVGTRCDDDGVGGADWAAGVHAIAATRRLVRLTRWGLLAMSHLKVAPNGLELSRSAALAYLPHSRATWQAIVRCISARQPSRLERVVGRLCAPLDSAEFADPTTQAWVCPASCYHSTPQVRTVLSTEPEAII